MDAVSIAEASHNKGQSSASGAPKAISSNTKTSGVSNLVGAANNSLTGKNPFAILKASAMPTQNPVYPNNFTNLPKANPPFLAPVEAI
mmetsp:Transcript_14747/g.14352  ORF Transcript_14747/g.14352 Transcript_14747/m.14352 type:complete len:88 (+) Transcript_14747:1242-1505(+)